MNSLSKSLIFTNKKDFKKISKKDKNQLLNIKEEDFSKNLKNIQIYDIFLQNEVQIKYDINKIFLNFEDNLKHLNFSNTKAPFIPNTFNLWRFQAWKKIEMLTKGMEFKTVQKIKKNVLEKIDGYFFICFCNKIKEPYFNLVFFENYKMPVIIDENMKQNLGSCKIIILFFNAEFLIIILN